jgi:enoyl-CoA hydratase/carnithine racemase
MSDDTLLIETRGPAAIVTFNRPDKGNALTLAMFRQLAELVGELGERAAVRAIILRGNDKYFSSGMDLEDMSGRSTVSQVREALEIARAANAALERCPKPVIAAISGYCLTGGLELALACDLRIAAENARFGITSSRIGTVAGMGGTQRLPRLVGPAKAKELLFSAEFIDAREAGRIGLVNRVVDNGAEVEAALALAAVLAQRAPLGLAFAKTAVDVGMTMPLEAALFFEIGLTAQLYTTEDKAEGIRAFLEKRPAEFRGR